MIDKHFIYFKTEEEYKLNKSQIKDTSIVFIEDKGKIVTHGHSFGGGGQKRSRIAN